MTPKVLTFAPHAEMVILIYIIIKERSGLPDEQETFTQVTSTVSLMLLKIGPWPGD